MYITKKQLKKELRKNKMYYILQLRYIKKEFLYYFCFFILGINSFYFGFINSSSVLFRIVVAFSIFMIIKELLFSLRHIYIFKKTLLSGTIVDTKEESYKNVISLNSFKKAELIETSYKVEINIGDELHSYWMKDKDLEKVKTENIDNDIKIIKESKYKIGDKVFTYHSDENHENYIFK